jgi:hypothetical protein
MNIGPVIRPKTGHNRYCGPAALSMIARIDTAEAAALLRKVSGKTSIKGAHTHHMRRALELKGFRVQRVELPPEKVTLAAWLKANPTSKRGTGVYLIACAHHFITVQGRRGGCSLTKDVVALSELKKRRGIMESVLLVEAPGPATKQRIAAERRLQPFKTVATAQAALAKALAEREAANQKVAELQKRLTLTREAVEAANKRAAQNSTSRARAKAQALAKQIGCTIEAERLDGYTTYWVGHPTFAEDETGDPCLGDHSCGGWHEVLTNVEAYRDHFAKAVS